MSQKRHRPEEIVAKLGEADVWKPRQLVHDATLSNDGVSGKPGAIHSRQRPKVTGSIL